MKIELQTNPDNGRLCLFDTRSGRFFKGGCVKNEDSAQDLLATANAIVRRSYKTLVQMSRDCVYGEHGYLDHMIAREYITLNPDILDKVLEKIGPAKTDSRTVRGKKARGRKPKYDTTSVNEDFEGEEPEVKRRGRPKKEKIEADPNAPKRGRGRPRKEKPEPDPNAVKRGRGRPRKIVSEDTPPKPKGKRGRPRKVQP